MQPKSLSRLTQLLLKVPGVGSKSAQRMAMHVLQGSLSDAEELASAILELKRNIRTCSVCFHLGEEDPCEICRDESREGSILLVVEQPADVLSIERAGSYRGRYHVLQGVLSPIDGVTPDQIRIRELLQRVSQNGVREVIIATNPTVPGETTAIHLAQLLREKQVRVSRIGRGIPMGGVIDYADEQTITRALEGRTDLNL